MVPPCFPFLSPGYAQDHNALRLIRGQGQGAGVQAGDGFIPAEGEVFVQGGDDFVAEVFAAVVHGDEHAGRQLLYEGVDIRGLHGKEAADGHEHDVNPFEQILLILGREAADVAHVGDSILAVVEDADDIVAALRALRVVVPGVDLRDPEGTCLSGRIGIDADTLGGVVVVVAVAVVVMVTVFVLRS